MSTVTEKVKETGLICTPESVSAILEGHKTQTRRVIRNVYSEVTPVDGVKRDCIRDLDLLPSRLDIAPDNWELCPYGVPGERLWVRERWRLEGGFNTSVCYFTKCFCGLNGVQGEKGWKSPRFMPKWACRIWLEITRVRVERVQDISYDDCIAEGIVDVARAEKRKSRPGERPIEQFATRWEILNLPRGYGWDLNPWVWVIEFKKLEGK